MKKMFIAAFAAFISLLPVSACGSNSDAGQEDKEYPVIKFENDQRKFDFGDTPRGQKISHVFKFRNTGKAPLIIKDVASSCGCTTPEYPREPIMPGKTGEIKMTFNGEGYDRFIKSVTLVLNTREGREVLYITGKLTDKADKKK